MSRVEEAIEKSTALAADDAKHDFKGARGVGGAAARVKAAIKKILGKKDTISFTDCHEKIKEIGTASKPTGPLHDEDGAWTYTFGAPREAFQKGREGRITMGGEYSYSWKVMKFAEKRAKETAATAWIPTSDQIFSYLTEHQADKSALYFLIDAVNVKFYEPLFEKENRAVGKSAAHKKAFYIDCREGENDAAGKPRGALEPYVKATADRAVRLEIIQDDYEVNILYPRYEPDTPPMPRKYFNSIYNVTIQTKGSAARHVTTTFSDKKFTHIVQVNKGVREEHPNSVNQILPRLAAVFKKLGLSASGADSTDAKNQYFTLLQQKRSGDWLQVLSCLDTDRYPAIPKGNVIWLCTEDIICACYAALRGVNVLYTWFDSTGYYTIRFARDDQAGTPTEQLLNKAAVLPDPADLQFMKSGETYTGLIQHFQSQIKVRKEAQQAAVHESIAEFSKVVAAFSQTRRITTDSKKGVEKAIRGVLIEALRLATFYSVIPSVHDETRAISQIQSLQNPSKRSIIFTAKDISSYKTLLQHYESDVETLREIVVNGKGRTDVLTAEQAINSGLTSILSTSSIRKAFETQAGLINRLTIFGSLFGAATASTHAIGIFQLLNAMPDREIKTDIAAAFQKLVTVAERSTEPKLKKDISNFSKAAAFLIIETGSLPSNGDLSDRDISKALMEYDELLQEETEGQRGGDPENGRDTNAEEEDFYLSPIQVSLFTSATAIQTTRYKKTRGTWVTACTAFLTLGSVLLAGLGAAALGATAAPGTLAQIQGGGGKAEPEAHPMVGLFYFVRELLFFYLEAGRDVDRAARLAQFLMIYSSLYEPFLKSLKQESNPFGARMYFSFLERILFGFFPVAGTAEFPDALKPLVKVLGIDPAFLREITTGTLHSYFGTWRFKEDEAMLSFEPYRQLLDDLTDAVRDAGTGLSASVVTGSLHDLYKALPDQMGRLYEKEVAGYEYMQSATIKNETPKELRAPLRQLFIEQTAGRRKTRRRRPRKD